MSHYFTNLSPIRFMSSAVFSATRTASLSSPVISALLGRPRLAAGLDHPDSAMYLAAGKGLGAVSLGDLQDAGDGLGLVLGVQFGNPDVVRVPEPRGLHEFMPVVVVAKVLHGPLVAGWIAQFHKGFAGGDVAVPLTVKSEDRLETGGLKLLVRFHKKSLSVPVAIRVLYTRVTLI
jgi:hypothetical protein